VKLVHHCIEQRAAVRFFLAIAPRFEAASLRVEHELGGTEERPLFGPAVARCLLHHVVIHYARSYTRRNAAFSASKLPSELAREVAYSQRPSSHASERDPEATVVIVGMSSPPSNTRVLRTLCLSGRMARRRHTTVSGSAPVLPAAHQRASTVHTGHPVATAPEPKRPIGRWPNRRQVRSGNPQASRSRRAPAFTPHPGTQSCSTQKITARRDRSACALVTGRHPLTCRLAPSSRSKLALFFCSVPK
jgi:hypothetical protein